MIFCITFFSLGIYTGKRFSLNPLPYINQGLDGYQTQTKIKREMKGAQASVACIGIAGEKKSRIAAIINDHGRVAGRTGMGAVMGSKKLKAIAVSGETEPHLADEDTFNEASQQSYGFLKEDVTAEMFRLGGTAVYIDIGMMYGDVPVRHYTRGDFNVSGLIGSAISEAILIDHNGCCLFRSAVQPIRT